MGNLGCRILLERWIGCKSDGGVGVSGIAGVGWEVMTMGAVVVDDELGNGLGLVGGHSSGN